MDIKMPIYKSKYTKGVSSEEVCFSKGDKVRYRMRSGEQLDIIIDSIRKYTVENSNILYGYDSIFLDDNKHYFAAEKGIINWEGKC